jgi:lambda repressor-like predicted transcriptional regulator
MKNDDLSLEIEEMLKNARPLDEIDLDGLAEANRALSRDPKHVASIMKGVFVNDILSAMQEQGLNKSQLALKWGKSRQYLNSVLDRENPGNFTIDTMVSLSMVLGLRPGTIALRKMNPAEAPAARTATRIKFVGRVAASGWCAPFECDRSTKCPASKPMPVAGETGKREDMAGMAA